MNIPCNQPCPYNTLRGCVIGEHTGAVCPFTNVIYTEPVKPLTNIDREKVYENACAGCTRHGEKPGECYHDEPCERLISAFTRDNPELLENEG